MIECPICGCEHHPGTLFCSGCGAYIPNGGHLRTELLPDEESPISQANPLIEEPVQEPTQTPSALLHIQVIHTDRLIRIFPALEVHVGRCDASQDILPDLDLGPDGGRERGVSRRHCKIRQHGSTYLVVDLASANGTFINGQRLIPYISHMIKDGDELRLGCLKLRVIIQ